MTDFAQIFHRHWPDLLRFCLYLSGNAAEAEDLAAEAFLRAWTSTRPILLSTVKAYLFVIARNLYLDRLRRRPSVGVPSELLADSGPGPDAVACDRAELERVVGAMQRLPEADRAILAMAAFASMSHEMIAAALEISVGAVKVRIHRARLRLGVALQHTREIP
jgi:RNA polymerase sigma-70 factor, ECF subfamily